jgi:hypothetical protein
MVSEIPAGPEGIRTNWLTDLRAASSTAAQLKALGIPARKPIVGDWFKEGDLGFIFGLRGLGKTWLAMHLAGKCAEGGAVADWPVTGRWPVLYIDSEMALDSMLERDDTLRGSGPPPDSPVHYLQHEALFHCTGKVLNLTKPLVQSALLDLCLEKGFKILVLDNLSCLFTGIKENDADAWEKVLPWLLDLRRNRIAVIFVAHAGRNGATMRGTSRREDSAFWMIHLSEVSDPSSGPSGARFAARFVKNRNATDDQCPALEWHFCRAPGGAETLVKWRKLSSL